MRPNYFYIRNVMHHTFLLKRIVLRGFTLVELLVVFSIIGIVSTVSVASFVDYSRTQTLKAATSELQTLLTQAKSKAQSQVKPDICGTNTLTGYEVRICGLSGSACTTDKTYALYVLCGSTTAKISSKKLPDSLSFSPSQTTSVTYTFNVLHKGVSGAGNVVLSGYNKNSVVSVTTSGAISVQ